MIAEFATALVSLVLWVAVIWGLVALVSLKFRSLRRGRHLYTKFILRCLSFIWTAISESIKWLWRGQGHSGAAHMASPPRLTSKDDDQW